MKSLAEAVVFDASARPVKQVAHERRGARRKRPDRARRVRAFMVDASRCSGERSRRRHREGPRLRGRTGASLNSKEVKDGS